MFGTQGSRFNQVDSPVQSFFCSQFNVYLSVQASSLEGYGEMCCVADKKIKVADADAHFIKFCRKRGPYKQGELF